LKAPQVEGKEAFFHLREGVEAKRPGNSLARDRGVFLIRCCTHRWDIQRTWISCRR